MPINSEEYTDEYYVELACKGDEPACEYLLNKYKSMVGSMARAFFLIGSDRDDLIQEGMIGLYKAICSFKSERNISFENYARLCIKSQILTAIRTASRIKHKPLNEYVSLEEETEYIAEDDPEEKFISEESYELLNTEINKVLSSFEISVLQLFLTGKSYKEMSAILNRDVKAIDNALSRIKKKLKCLKE